MEGEVLNLISNLNEGSYSNSSSDPCRPNKRQRDDNPTSSTRFKGVVLQQNGHWGAQIYANHQRIWLGTFKSEKAAAKAYDSAAIKLRSGESHRNFPWTNITIQEPNFQDHHTTEAILNMIKDGSYESKFADYVRSQSSNMTKEAQFDLRSVRVDEGGISYQQLFQKELTPSDVGKLNRLVIPKKHATKYFPQVSEDSTVGEDDGTGSESFQLVFVDRRLKSWKFRYCYWKSSQSYVFTRGWNRFVKEKELKAKDVVTFYKCDYVEGFTEEKSFCMIDVCYNGGGSEGPGVVEGFGGCGKEKVELKLELGLSFDCRYDDEEAAFVEPVAKKAVKLFGAEIS